MLEALFVLVVGLTLAVANIIVLLNLISGRGLFDEDLGAFISTVAYAALTFSAIVGVYWMVTAVKAILGGGA